MRFDEWWEKHGERGNSHARNAAMEAWDAALETMADEIEKDDTQKFGWVVDHPAIAAWLRSRATP